MEQAVAQPRRRSRIFPEELPEQQRAPAPTAEEPEPETGFGENFGATFSEMMFVGNVASHGFSRGLEYTSMIDALHARGEMVPTPINELWGTLRMPFENPYMLPDEAEPGHLSREEMITQVWAAVRRQRQRDPNFLREYGNSREELEVQIQRRQTAALARVRDVQRRATGWGKVGGFAGGMAGSLLDPPNLLTLPFGGSGRTVLGSMARTGAENMAIEAISAPYVHRNYLAVGEELSLADHAQMLLFAGAGGAAFRGAMIGVGRAGGAVYDRGVTALFDAVPESVQQRWLGAMTIDDVPLADIVRARIPLEAWDPELRSAVHVLEREREIAEASPFVRDPDGDDAHGAGLAAALQRLIDEAPPVAGAAARGVPERSGPASGFVDSFSRYMPGSSGPGTPRPYRGGSHASNARDFRTPMGTPLVAELDWELTPSPRRQDGGRSQGEDRHGKWFSVRYSDGSVHILRHVSTLPVAQSGRAGEMMARSGASGIGSSGPHTHRESWVSRDGRLVGIDPQTYIEGARGGHGPVQTTGEPRQASVSDAQLKAAMRRGESGGRDDASNPMSGQTAAGRYGFTDATWLSLHRRVAPGRMSNAERLAQRSNGEVQERIMDAALAEYRSVLSRAGVEATPANLYLSHFVSPQDAINVSRSPEARLDATLARRHRADFVDQVFAANPNLRRDMTNGEVIAEMQRRTGGVETGPSAPIARSADGSDATAIADLEAQLAARDAADAAMPVSRADDDVAEAITGLPPTLRRDLFDSDAAWGRAQAQADLSWRIQNGLQDPNTRPGAAPVAHLTGRELGEIADNDGSAVVATARDWYRANLQGTSVSRPEVGDINFTDKGWAKARRRLPLDPDKARLFPAIPAIIRDGEYQGRAVVDKKRKDDVVAFHHFAADVRVGDRDFRAGVTVAENSRGKLFYNLNRDPELRLATRRDSGLTRGKARAPEPRNDIDASVDDLNLDLVPAFSSGRRADLRASTSSLALREASFRRFDEPGGEGATIQVDSLSHDLRAAIAADPTLGERHYRISEDSEETRPLAQILDALDNDVEAAAALKACLK